MEKKRIKYFKVKLLKEKEEQIKSLEKMEKEEDINPSETELSSYDNHPADIGTEVYMMEQEKGFKEQIKETIEKIDSSLEDIENGSYSFCENCNKDISEERLELIPYAKTCLGCMDNEDIYYKDKLNDKKVYESLNYKSFDLNSNKDNIGYDSEDAYEDIMKDNIIPKDPSYSTGDNMGLINDNDEADIVEDVEKISEEYYKDSIK